MLSVTPASMEISPQGPSVPNLKTERKRAVRALMREKGWRVKDVVQHLPEGEDRTQWRNFLYNLNSEMVNLSLERAEKLATVFGVDPMVLLIQSSDGERKKIEDVLSGKTTERIPAAAVPQNSASAVPEAELKRLQQAALEGIMTERKLSARKLAGMIEQDEFNADMIAMQIADARQGNIALEKDLCGRITTALGVDSSILYPTSTAQAASIPVTSPLIASVTAEPTPKRAGGRKRKEVIQSEQPASQETGLTQEASIELSVEDVQRYFGGRAFTVLRLPDGKHLLRAERTISKDELIEVLLRLHRK